VTPSPRAEGPAKGRARRASRRVTLSAKQEEHSGEHPWLLLTTALRPAPCPLPSSTSSTRSAPSTRKRSSCGAQQQRLAAQQQQEHQFPAQQQLQQQQQREEGEGEVASGAVTAPPRGREGEQHTRHCSAKSTTTTSSSNKSSSSCSSSRSSTCGCWRRLLRSSGSWKRWAPLLRGGTPLHRRPLNFAHFSRAAHLYSRGHLENPIR